MIATPIVRPLFRRSLCRRLTGSLLLAWGLAAQAAPSAKPLIAVSAGGTTHLSGTFEGVTVTAEIAGHSLPPDRPAGQYRRADVRCTGSRNPCMLVDALTIRVNGHGIEVPRSVVVALSDVNRAGLQAGGANRYKLVVECGDASQSYTAILWFDRKRVTQRDVIDSEAGMVAERTIYGDLSRAFRD